MNPETALPVKPLCLFLLLFFLSLCSFGQAPSIAIFSPPRGPVGTEVVIYGSGFSTTPGENIVYFGAVKATVKMASFTALTVTVPIGAAYQRVTVTTRGLTAYSISPFKVTFGNGNVPLQASFAARTIGFTSTYNYGNLELMDFDGDGRLDACNNGGQSGIAMQRNGSGIGNPYFSQPFYLDRGNAIFAISDLDGNGKGDVITTFDANGDYIGIDANISASGSLSFAPRVTIRVGLHPEFITADDLDGDGKPDLLLASSGKDYLQVFRNTTTNGTISFAYSINPNIPSNNGVSIFTGDVDGDLKPDILVSGGSFFSVLKNKSTPGNLSFENAVNFISINCSSYFIVAGDFNNDDKIDFALPGYNKIKVFTNITANGIIDFDSGMELPWAGTAHYGCGEDLDGDGKLDLAIVNSDSGTVNVFSNTSTGDQISFAPKVSFDAGWQPRGIRAGDVDGDGKPDLVVLNNVNIPGIVYPGGISVLRNTTGEVRLQSFSPSSGYSGTKISIKGSNLSMVKTVDFGGKPAAAFTIVSDSLVEAIVGTGSTGSIKLTTTYDSSMLAGFTYIEPVSLLFCPPTGNKVINAGITGSAYQWQASTDSGITFTDISNGDNYSGVNAATLRLAEIPSEWYGHQYRCMVNGVASNIFKVKFINNWTGTVSTNWENAENWSCGILPDANTDVAIPGGNIILSTNASCRSLAASNGATITIQPGVTLTITH